MIVLVDSEEFTSSADLFSEIKLISPAVNQHGARPTARIAPQAAANNTDDMVIDTDVGPDGDNVDLGTGTQGNFDETDDIQLDSTSLDDHSDDEVSGGDPNEDNDKGGIGGVPDLEVAAADIAKLVSRS